MRILKWQGKVSFEDSYAGGENPFCLHDTRHTNSRIAHCSLHANVVDICHNLKTLKRGGCTMGRFPFPRLIRVKKAQKPSKRSKNTSKKGGSPKRPFYPNFESRFFGLLSS